MVRVASKPAISLTICIPDHPAFLISLLLWVVCSSGFLPAWPFASSVCRAIHPDCRLSLHPPAPRFPWSRLSPPAPDLARVAWRQQTAGSPLSRSLPPPFPGACIPPAPKRPNPPGRAV